MSLNFLSKLSKATFLWSNCPLTLFYMGSNTGQVFSKRIEITPQIHIRKFKEQTALGQFPSLETFLTSPAKGPALTQSMDVKCSNFRMWIGGVILTPFEKTWLLQTKKLAKLTLAWIKHLIVTDGSKLLQEAVVLTTKINLMSLATSLCVKFVKERVAKKKIFAPTNVKK